MYRRIVLVVALLCIVEIIDSTVCLWWEYHKLNSIDSKLNMCQEVAP